MCFKNCFSAIILPSLSSYVRLILIHETQFFVFQMAPYPVRRNRIALGHLTTFFTSKQFSQRNRLGDEGFTKEPDVDPYGHAHAERLATAEANAERAFSDLDRSQASLDLVREEPLLTERTERFDEIHEPLERSVREYIDASYREDGLHAFRDADLAEEHVAGQPLRANRLMAASCPSAFARTGRCPRPRSGRK